MAPLALSCLFYLLAGKTGAGLQGRLNAWLTRKFLQSGAKINISDGSCPERIVTVTGSTDAIYKAFTLICNKFEEVSGNLDNT